MKTVSVEYVELHAEDQVQNSEIIHNSLTTNKNTKHMAKSSFSVPPGMYLLLKKSKSSEKNHRLYFI